MIEEIKNINTNKSEIRKFGFLVGSVLIAISFFMIWKGISHYQLLLITGIFLILAGLIIPLLLKPVYIVWMTFAKIMGWIMTRVILAVLFFIIVTPIGIVSRIFKVQFLDLSWPDNKESYWNKRENRTSNLDKQF